jgi:hypothetical protein
MNRLAICAIVPNFLLIPIASTASAGVSGDTEIRLLVDKSRFGETETSLEQWNALTYKDLTKALDIGVQFSIEADETNETGRLYQCYIHSGGRDEGPDITIGRFEMVDSSGFYTLDGASFSQRLDPLSWKLYAGKPRRFESYWDEDADLVLGLGSDVSLLPLIQAERFTKLSFNLGLERRWSHARQMNLHLSLSGEQHELDEVTQIKDFFLSADMRLDNQTLQRVVIDSHYDLNAQGSLRLGYRYYRPLEEPETFRDRYHGFYSMDRQSVLKGIWHMPKIGRVEPHFELNGIRQDHGNGGLGLAAELVYPTGYGPVWDCRADYLETDDDYAISGYLRYRQPITSTSIARVETVYQKKQTQLSGDNNLKGLSVSISQRYLSQWVFDVGGEWLDYSERDDEYRLALSVQYEFYQTNVGELP